MQTKTAHTLSGIMASVLIGLCSSHAQASTIVATYAGSANFGHGGVGYESGYIAPNPNSSTSQADVGIGGDSFTSTNKTYAFSSTGQFNTWCVDIYHWMSGGTVTYNVETGSNLATDLSNLRSGTPTGATRVADLIELADEQYSLVNTANSETDSAAFQLAVWAIAYGSLDAAGNFQIDTTDPDFNVSSAVATSAYGELANTWLNELGTVKNTGNYTLTYLDDGSAENTQDVIVFTDPLPVPEPTTVALLGLGLAGLAFFRRKSA